MLKEDWSMEDGKETSEDAESERDSEEELISVSYFFLGYIMTGEQLRKQRSVKGILSCTAERICLKLPTYRPQTDKVGGGVVSQPGRLAGRLTCSRSM